MIVTAIAGNQPLVAPYCRVWYLLPRDLNMNTSQMLKISLIVIIMMMLGLFYLTNEVGIFWDQKQSQPGNKNVYVLGLGCNNDFSSIVLVNILQRPLVIFPSDVCVALIDSRKRFQLGHHCFVKVYLLATALHHKNMTPIGTILAICTWHIIINNWHYPCKL